MTATWPSLAEVASAIGRDSCVLAAADQAARRPDNALGLLVRELTRQEIAIMEARGCRSDDWSCVAVAEDFDPFRVRRTHFVGRCVLGRFTGEVQVIPGMTLPTGIYDSTLIDCQVGNDVLIENVRFARNIVVAREAVLFDVGSITCTGETAFGCDRELSVGIETGGREVPLWAEMDIPMAAAIASRRDDHDGLGAVSAAAVAYRERLQGTPGWVERGAVVRHTDLVRDSYVGAAAVIDHALEVGEVTVLSSPDEPASIGGGAQVTGSVLQWGAEIGGNAVVRDAALLEHSGVDANAVVEQSIIGPNTAIAKGEVTASLVGPFVGFHHQSLLIAAFWPEGKGNIAYGAMVGSNHTGRAPDQEIFVGEGTFFGLGCSIRMPADLSQAPYSVISAGVNTLAQRITFPFSLVTTPADPLDEAGMPRAYNEILPGWGLYANAYAVERAEAKFAKRDSSKRHALEYKILRPDIIAMVRDALHRLEAISEPKAIYRDDELPGLGKNFLREPARLGAIDAYRRTLRRYALRTLLGQQEDRITIPGSVEIAEALLDDLMPATDLGERLRELVRIERDNADIVEASKAADDVRGARIIPGYAAAHAPAADDPVVALARRRAETTAQRVAAVLGEAVTVDNV